MIGLDLLPDEDEGELLPRFVVYDDPETVGFRWFECTLDGVPLIVFAEPRTLAALVDAVGSKQVGD